MKQIKNYINELFREIPDSIEKENIMQDIIQNLEEKVYDLMRQGKEEEDAINKAIVEFGDIEDIKKELTDKHPIKNNVHKLNLQFSLAGSGLIIALFLFINFYYTPRVIWFVYPTFGVIWWPLVMFFKWSRSREESYE